MRRFYIEIEDDAVRTIQDLAIVERRSTRDQAAVLLQEAAKRAIRGRKPSGEIVTEWDGYGRHLTEAGAA